MHPNNEEGPSPPTTASSGHFDSEPPPQRRKDIVAHQYQTRVFADRGLDLPHQAAGQDAYISGIDWLTRRSLRLDPRAKGKDWAANEVARAATAGASTYLLAFTAPATVSTGELTPAGNPRSVRNPGTPELDRNKAIAAAHASKDFTGRFIVAPDPVGVKVLTQATRRAAYFEKVAAKEGYPIEAAVSIEVDGTLRSRRLLEDAMMSPTIEVVAVLPRGSAGWARLVDGLSRVKLADPDCGTELIVYGSPQEVDGRPAALLAFTNGATAFMRAMKRPFVPPDGHETPDDLTRAHKELVYRRNHGYYLRAPALRADPSLVPDVDAASILGTVPGWSLEQALDECFVAEVLGAASDSDTIERVPRDRLETEYPDLMYYVE